MQRIFKILMLGPLEGFNRHRSSHKDVHQIILRTPRGFHQDLFRSF